MTSTNNKHLEIADSLEKAKKQAKKTNAGNKTTQILISSGKRYHRAGYLGNVRYYVFDTKKLK